MPITSKLFRLLRYERTMAMHLRLSYELSLDENPCMEDAVFFAVAADESRVCF